MPQGSCFKTLVFTYVLCTQNYYFVSEFFNLVAASVYSWLDNPFSSGRLTLNLESTHCGRQQQILLVDKLALIGKIQLVVAILNLIFPWEKGFKFILADVTVFYFIFYFFSRLIFLHYGEGEFG